MFVRRAWLLFTIILTSGCALRMQVPPGLEQADELAVSGRPAVDRFAAEELSFGDYRVHGIARGYTATHAGRVFFGKSPDELELYPETDSYSFNVEGQRHWGAVCSTADRTSLVPGIDAGDVRRLECTCATAANGAVATVSLAGETEVLRGMVSTADASFAVAGTRNLAGHHDPHRNASGYIVSRQSEVVAAVDVLDEPRMWLQAQLPGEHRDAIACASVALLLHH